MDRAASRTQHFPLCGTATPIASVPVSVTPTSRARSPRTVHEGSHAAPRRLWRRWSLWGAGLWRETAKRHLFLRVSGTQKTGKWERRENTCQVEAQGRWAGAGPERREQHGRERPVSLGSVRGHRPGSSCHLPGGFTALGVPGPLMVWAVSTPHGHTWDIRSGPECSG